MSERRKIRRLMGDVKEEYGDRVADYAKEYGKWYVRPFTNPIDALRNPLPPNPFRNGARRNAERRRRIEEREESRGAPPRSDRGQVEAIEIREYGPAAIEPTDDE